MNKVAKYPVQVDFFTGKGNWKYGGVVEVEHMFWDDGFKQDIVNNQSIINDGWQGEFIVVTSNVDDSCSVDTDETGYLTVVDSAMDETVLVNTTSHPFAHHIFFPSKFEGVVKTTDK